MSRNKNWKRKAKRILGNCITSKCENCKYGVDIYDDYLEEFNKECSIAYPRYDGIRLTEKIIKEGNLKRK